MLISTVKRYNDKVKSNAIAVNVQLRLAKQLYTGGDWTSFHAHINTISWLPSMDELHKNFHKQDALKPSIHIFC